MILVQVGDICVPEGLGPSTTSQHSPAASQPRIDQLRVLDVASFCAVLLPLLKKQKESEKILRYVYL
jgi:hypothetical protein